MPFLATRVAHADPPVRARPVVAPLSHFENASQFPADARLIAIRKGGTIRVTEGGLLHIVEPVCRPISTASDQPHDEPDVLWYVVSGCLQYTGQPIQGYSAFPPYMFPNQPPTTYPNPNNPSALPGHPNITRHWVADTMPVPWMFNVPDVVQPPSLVNGARPGASHKPILDQDVFFTCGVSGAWAYSYGEALWDVALMMARFSGFTTTPDLPSSSTWGAAGGVLPYPAPSPYDCPPDLLIGCQGPWSAPPMGIRWTILRTSFVGYTYHAPYVIPTSIAPAFNGLIWEAPSGPTGDGTNEVCWCSGSFPALVAQLGVTSMLVDPTTGAIVECDICFEAVPTATGLNWPQGNNSVYSPGNPSPYSSGGFPSFGAPSSTSIIPHELGHFFGLDHTNLHPGTNPGGWGAGPVSGATITSAFLFPSSWNNWPLMAAGVYWANANAAPGGWSGMHVTGASATRPGVDPAAGTLHPDEITGICRLYPATGASAGSRALINDFARIEGQTLLGATTPVPTWGRNVYPLLVTNNGATLATNAPNAAVSGTHRVSGSSVVGALDSGQDQPSTGDFILPYLPADADDGAEYALGAELMTSLVGLGSLGEWWGPVAGTGNPLNKIVFNTTPAAGTPVLLASRKQYSGSKGSLFVFPGSVVTVTINESLGVPQPGTLIGKYTETVSRPAVKLVPRTGPTLPTTVITATVHSDFPIRSSAAYWTVDSQTVPARDPTTGPAYPPVACGPYVYTWTRTAGELGITSGTLVRFSVQESASPLGEACGPQPAGFAVGVNECWY